MYTTARQVPAQTTVTISVSAIDGIQMPQSQAPAPMQPQQPCRRLPKPLLPLPAKAKRCPKSLPRRNRPRLRSSRP